MSCSVLSTEYQQLKDQVCTSNFDASEKVMNMLLISQIVAFLTFCVSYLMVNSNNVIGFRAKFRDQYKRNAIVENADSKNPQDNQQHPSKDMESALLQKDQKVQGFWRDRNVLFRRDRQDKEK